jgi:hypothetical protein
MEKDAEAVGRACLAVLKEWPQVMVRVSGDVAFVQGRHSEAEAYAHEVTRVDLGVCGGVGRVACPDVDKCDWGGCSCGHEEDGDDACTVPCPGCSDCQDTPKESEVGRWPRADTLQEWVEKMMAYCDEHGMTRESCEGCTVDCPLWEFRDWWLMEYKP